MKRTLSLVLAVIMVCSVVLSALPSMVSASTAYSKRWSLRDELSKAAASAGITDQADFSNSAFKLQYYSNGAFVDLKYATKAVDGKDFTFSRLSATVRSEGNNEPSQAPWKSGFVVTAAGAIRSGYENKAGKLRIAFEAPADGTYYIDPIAVNANGATAVARAYDCAVKIYTDTYNYATVNVRTTGKAADDDFATDGEVWLEMKKDEMLYLEIDPQAADTYDGKDTWINNGVGVTMNFDVVLDEAATSSVSYSTVYNPKDLIGGVIPAKGYKNPSKTESDKNLSDVEKDVWYRWPDEIPSAIFNMESRNSWDQPKWGKSTLFKNSDANVQFAYPGSNFNVGNYNASVSKTSNAITLSSWATAVAWRLSFTAPATKTYYIDMGKMTVSAATQQRVTFKIYKSTALNADGALSSDAAALLTYNFYQNRTDSWSPCMDGMIPVAMNAGEKLYFEIQYDGGLQYQGNGNNLAGSFSLSIKADPKTVNNVYNNNITLDKESYEFNSSNNSFKLNATGVSGANVGTDLYWYSTDPSVATVDQNGNVTKVGTSGNCKIVAGNAFDTDSCYVTIGSLTEINSVTLNKTSVTIDEYASEVLTYTTNPSNGDVMNVEWASDNEDVVRVNGGRLIFVSEGTANVTVTVNGKTASCRVTTAYHDCEANASDVVLVQPDCDTPGTKSSSCSKCGNVLGTFSIPELGHDIVETIESYPTWNTTGRKTAVCKRTGCNFEEDITMPVGIVSSIEITGELEKKVYDFDEEFDANGIGFIVHYSNYEHTTEIETAEGITFDYDFSAAEGDGMREVSFTVAGKEMTLEVMVSEGGLVIIGDADNNGEVTTEDTIAILKYISGYNVEIKPKNADINNDGKVDIADVVLLLQHIAGYEVAGL